MALAQSAQEDKEQGLACCLSGQCDSVSNCVAADVARSCSRTLLSFLPSQDARAKVLNEQRSDTGYSTAAAGGHTAHFFAFASCTTGTRVSWAALAAAQLHNWRLSRHTDTYETYHPEHHLAADALQP